MEERKNPRQRANEAAEGYAANTNRVKKRFHAFQRDADQNNGDPRIQHLDPTYPHPPEANYRAPSLTGQQKMDFLNAIGFFEDDGSGYCLADYLEQCRVANPTSNLRSRADFEDPNIPLKLLICRNDHSVGLIGKEGSYDKINDDAHSHNLHALVRALGSSEKSGGFGGGTFGFGKVLFYDHSTCRMVFYYSPCIHRKECVSSHTGDITRRFIGVNWLQSDIDMDDNSNMRSRKSHFGVLEDIAEIDGFDGEGTTVRSLYNEAATLLLNQ